jgi:hypothetical protein
MTRWTETGLETFPGPMDLAILPDLGLTIFLLGRTEFTVDAKKLIWNPLQMN